MRTIAGFNFPDPDSPDAREQADEWEHTDIYQALDTEVLVVARTRIEGAWAAYCFAHDCETHEEAAALYMAQASKLPEPIARAIFPKLKDLRYAP